MAKKIKKDQKDDQSQFNSSKDIIYGAFIVAERLIQHKLKGIYKIKLSTITTIEPIFIDGIYQNECFFYTYKDCCYYVRISATELRNAINSFLFEPDTHWESYSD